MTITGQRRWSLARIGARVCAATEQGISSTYRVESGLETLPPSRQW